MPDRCYVPVVFVIEALQPQTSPGLWERSNREAEGQVMAQTKAWQTWLRRCGDLAGRHLQSVDGSQ
jgi:hypothetical protein